MLMPTDLVPGTLVGPWLVQERLDWGNYGVVCRAQRAGHPESPPVALKMARHPRDPRFEREGRVLQQMQHPNIPRYEDSGLWTCPDGQRYPYVVMELVEGLTLYDWYGERRRSSRQVLAVLSQLASALTTAHVLGAVHRDVKGDNIRVTAAGRAVLVDWGSSWFVGARPLTDSTAPPGTTAYRPPEQRVFMWRFRKDLEARWQSQPSDDLYALGVCLYRLVTGVYLPPFTEGGEPVEREVLPPSTMATVCPALEEIILRLIDDDRKARGTAEQLAREADRLVQTAGAEADKPILPTAASSVPPKREEHCPRSEQHLHAWFALATAALVGGLLVFLGTQVPSTDSQQELTPSPWSAMHEEVSQYAPDAGVSEEALSAAQAVPRAVVPSILSLGRPMPSKPFPGQRRPPCIRGEREIYGACWLGPIEGQEPPCGDRMFDHEGRCYFASFDQDRQPTSDPP
jgi:serine/threonine protein kinase